MNWIWISSRYCRPIRLRFVKETAEITQAEIDHVENATKLQNTTFILNEKSYSVKHTMVDAKICNAATETTSTIRCYICGATSKEFNSYYFAPQIYLNDLRYQKKCRRWRTCFSIVYFACENVRIAIFIPKTKRNCYGIHSQSWSLSW